MNHIDKQVKLSDLPALFASNKAEYEKLEKEKQLAYTRWLELNKFVSDDGPNDSVKLYSAIVLDSDYFVKVSVTFYRNNPQRPYVSKTIYTLDEYGNPDILNEWNAVLNFPRSLVPRLCEIDQKLKDWNDNKITWPWTPISCRAYDTFWER